MERITKLETPHLILRKARETDLESILANIWSDREIAAMMLWKPTETPEEALQRMERTLKYQAVNDAFFVCLKENDEAVGFAGIREIAPGEYEETGICVARRFQRRGYGKEVVNAMTELAFERLGGRRFVYGCFHDNIPSAALCRSCGFTYTHSEKHTRDWDGYVYLCDFYELVRGGKKE